MSYTNSDQVIEALVGIVTAISSAITTNSTNPASAAVMATSINAQANTNDTPVNAVTKNLMLAVGTALAATNPSSSIRSSLYGA